MADDCEMCNNCKRDIPCSNYKMHTVHCMRNIALCPICDESIPRREYDEHKETCSKTFAQSLVPSAAATASTSTSASISSHSAAMTSKTSSTSASVSSLSSETKSKTSTSVAATSKSTTSISSTSKTNATSIQPITPLITPKPSLSQKQNPSKLVSKIQPVVAKVQEPMEICKYCKLEFIPKELPEHENYCGSRTEQCPECSDYVMLKDWEKHQAMRLYHELAKKPCHQVFGRDDLTSSNISPWSRTPSTYGLTRTPSSSALSRRRELEPFGVTDLSSKYQSSSRRKYSEPLYRSQSLSRKTSMASALLQSSSSTETGYSSYLDSNKSRENLSYSAMNHSSTSTDKLSSRWLEDNSSSYTAVTHSTSSTNWMEDNRFRDSSSYTALQQSSDKSSGRWLENNRSRDNSSYRAGTDKSVVLPVEVDYSSKNLESEWCTTLEEQAMILAKFEEESKKAKQSVKRSKSLATTAGVLCESDRRVESSRQNLLQTNKIKETHRISPEKDCSVERPPREGRSRRRKKASIVDSILTGNKPVNTSKEFSDLMTFSDAEDGRCPPPLETVPNLAKKSLLERTLDKNQNEVLPIKKFPTDLNKSSSFVDKYLISGSSKSAINENGFHEQSQTKKQTTKSIQKESHHAKHKESQNGREKSSASTQDSFVNRYTSLVQESTDSGNTRYKSLGLDSLPMGDTLTMHSNHQKIPLRRERSTSIVNDVLRRNNILQETSRNKDTTLRETEYHNQVEASPYKTEEYAGYDHGMESVGLNRAMTMGNIETTLNLNHCNETPQSTRRRKSSVFGITDEQTGFNSRESVRRKEMSNGHSNLHRASDTTELSLNSDTLIKSNYEMEKSKNSTKNLTSYKKRDLSAHTNHHEDTYTYKERESGDSSIIRAKEFSRHQVSCIAQVIDTDTQKASVREKTSESSLKRDCSDYSFRDKATSASSSTRYKEVASSSSVRNDESIRRKDWSASTDASSSSSSVRNNESVRRKDWSASTDASSSTSTSALKSTSVERTVSDNFNPLRHSKSLGGWAALHGATSCGYEEGMRRKRPEQYADPAKSEQHREKLRQMLCNLRKDPMDDDLENNDGSFFPCEFCGDPYPVEFLMRHQLSCDLNPSPVTSGQGFDYDLIAKRAAANIELARSADEVVSASGFKFD